MPTISPVTGLKRIASNEAPCLVPSPSVASCLKCCSAPSPLLGGNGAARATTGCSFCAWNWQTTDPVCGPLAQGNGLSGGGQHHSKGRTWGNQAEIPNIGVVNRIAGAKAVAAQAAVRERSPRGHNRVRDRGGRPAREERGARHAAAANSRNQQQHAQRKARHCRAELELAVGSGRTEALQRKRQSQSLSQTNLLRRLAQRRQ